jgi:SAM-dependent methyltransferase
MNRPSGESAKEPANERAKEQAKGSAHERADMPAAEEAVVAPCAADDAATSERPAMGPATRAAAEPAALTSLAPHNREKQRLLSLDRPFLQALGVTDQRRQLIPSMSRKWKQINRFIEVFAAAWKASALARSAEPLRLVDFGAGKGYLTFALHDYLRNSLRVPVQVTGVDLRADLVKAGNEIVAGLGIEGLSFSRGDIASYVDKAEPLDVVIALHACDTATDDAIHQGISAGAAIILCAPCCHKQLRSQVLSPHPLRPILQHGIHLGQEAEMLTDGLRALLMEAHGYDAQVFEFISLEHTSKNKMILAVKRTFSKPVEPVLVQIRDIKSFYGIREQRLESLLSGAGVAPAGPAPAGPAPAGPAPAGPARAGGATRAASSTSAISATAEQATA